MKKFLKQLFVLLCDIAEIIWLLLKLAWHYIKRGARGMAKGWRWMMNALSHGTESLHQSFERFKESIDVPEPDDEESLPLIEHHNPLKEKPFEGEKPLEEERTHEEDEQNE